MPVLAARPRRLALACAMISVVALGTVSASAATATGSTSTPSGTSTPSPEQRRGGQVFAVKYEPTDKAPDDVNEANDDFAACMRDAGQTVFPTFHAFKDDDGEIRLQTKVKGEHADLNLTGTADFRKALEKCAPIMEKAGVTFPDEDELPDHPRLPGKPGEADDSRPSPPDCGVITRTEPGQTQRS